jgi:hypothetical protein
VDNGNFTHPATREEAAELFGGCRADAACSVETAVLRTYHEKHEEDDDYAFYKSIRGWV